MISYTPQFSSMSNWQSLVNDAMQQTGYHCDDSVEHYLVLTLDHFTKNNHLSNAVIALDFLLALNSLGRLGGGKMREVGDECLLLAGLFPERIARKHVSLEYFIGMGQQAYLILTSGHFRFLYDSELFSKLSYEFPNLIEVLQTMRKIRTNSR